MGHRPVYTYIHTCVWVVILNAPTAHLLALWRARHTSSAIYQHHTRPSFQAMTHTQHKHTHMSTCEQKHTGAVQYEPTLRETVIPSDSTGQEGRTDWLEILLFSPFQEGCVRGLGKFLREYMHACMHAYISYLVPAKRDVFKGFMSLLRVKYAQCTHISHTRIYSATPLVWGPPGFILQTYTHVHTHVHSQTLTNGMVSKMVLVFSSSMHTHTHKYWWKKCFLG